MIPLSVPEILPGDGFCDEDVQRRGEELGILGVRYVPGFHLLPFLLIQNLPPATSLISFSPGFCFQILHHLLVLMCLMWFVGYQHLNILDSIAVSVFVDILVEFDKY